LWYNYGNMGKLTDTPKSKAVARKGRAVTGEVVRQGRPTKFSPELAASICEMLSEGMSLRTVCKHEGMPAMSQIFNWLNLYPSFQEQYTRAKEEAADALSEDIQAIADGTLKGTYDPMAARVAIDAYKWTASKLKPKKYGDKVDLTTNGKDLPSPLLGGIVIEDKTLEG